MTVRADQAWWGELTGSSYQKRPSRLSLAIYSDSLGDWMTDDFGSLGRERTNASRRLMFKNVEHQPEDIRTDALQHQDDDDTYGRM